MKILFLLFFEFFKTGLFAIGGWLGTIPFLYHMSVVYHWFDARDLAQMLAIANIFPGPIGANMASMIGFNVYGVLGSLIAVLGLLLPSLMFVLIISHVLDEFEGNKFVKTIFYVLKPASVGMICAIGLKLLLNIIFKPSYKITLASFDWLAIIVFAILISLSLKKEHSPLFYLGFAALAGILIYIVKSFLL